MSNPVSVTAPPKAGWLRRLYDWVLHWANTPYGLPALFVLAFLESSFFPIPPDVLLMALVLGKPTGWVRMATVCTVGSVLGAVAGYAIGMGMWGLVDGFFYRYVFSPEVFAYVVERYEAAAFLTVFTAAFTPIPFKVITIAAGVAQISIGALVIGSILGRGGRFFVVAGLLAYMGPSIKTFIDKYFGWLTLAFTALLIGGFVVVKMLL
jgi:membrane protein YqaA with SNARE-associated domain